MINNINFDFTKAKVLVVGDVMLDQYWYGNTTRISPEAPVPIVRIDNSDLRLGGAANVAWNLHTLGCKIKLLSVVGEDESALKLKQLLKDKGIAYNLINTSSFITVRKLRIISRHLQILRVDHEASVNKIPNVILENLSEELKKEISTNDYSSIIFSDYSKGLLINPQPFFDIAHKYNIPIYVDPKSNNFSIYKGATLIKPNMHEFERVVGKCNSLKELECKARNLIDSCNIQTIVITKGRYGISVVSKLHESMHVPAYSGKVFDVTGAGDTVIATLVAALCCNVNILDAIRLSSVAAAVVVSKMGTSTASEIEIKNLINANFNLPTGVVSVSFLKKIIQMSKSRGEKIVFINGCYDILHYGHIRYIERARKLGDRLIVAVNSDTSVQRLKGNNRPIYNVKQRMEVLSSISSVDWVVKFEDDTPGNLVKYLNPDILVKSGELFKNIASIPETEGAKYILENNGKVYLLDRTPNVSSTAAIENLDLINDHDK